MINAHPYKISIIIVTLNASATLQTCLDSIYEQEIKEVEIIVVDGASTDGTIAILEKNTRKIAFWISEPDHGIYDAMNKALNYVTSEWVYFLGADDILLKEFSPFCLCLKQKSKIYYARVITAGGPTDPVSRSNFVKIGICHQAIIYPSDIFLNNRFDTKYKISADYVFNMRLFGHTSRFEFQDFVIAKFCHTGISSTHIDPVFKHDRIRLILNNFGWRILMSYLFWKFKNSIKNSFP